MDWRKIVSSVAPAIGTALGGPFAGVATRFVAEKLLGKPDASIAEIKDAISTADPAKLERLKEVDAEFLLTMRRLDVDVFSVEVEDRKSARELIKINMLPQVVLTAIFVIGYFGVVYVMFVGSTAMDGLKDNAWAQGVLTTILGVLTAAVPQILGFWFGSSMGSKDKTARMTSNGLNTN